MDLFNIVFLTLSAFVSSSLTAVVGAGGGTLLIAIMLQVMAPAQTLPIHGAVQLAANTTRVWLLRRHMVWPLIWRFCALMPLGVALGLMLFQSLPTSVVQLLLGLFVLMSLGLRQLKALREAELPMWAYLPLGFVTGVLNMIVGIIAPVLGVLVIRKDMSKEATVGTLGFFGFMGNLLKVVAFVLAGFSFAEYWLLILCMVVAAILGTRVGRAVLANMDERLFRLVFQIALSALALKLILVDALALHRLIWP